MAEILDRLRLKGYVVMQLVDTGFSIFPILTESDLLPRRTLNQAFDDEKFLEYGFAGLQGAA